MKAAIIGAPLDLGAGRRGVDMGPSAIRYAGLEDRLCALGGDCVDRGNVAAAVAEATAEDDPRARFLPAIRATCERGGFWPPPGPPGARSPGQVGVALDEGRIPIVLGGDHSIALGTLGGLAARHGPGAVLWFDAHGDLNTPETTPSGNVHGMPLAAALGRGGPAFESPAWTLPALQPERVAVIGARDLDPGERALIAELGLAVHSMSAIDRRGIEAIVGEALERAAGAPFVHVSLDMDGLDPDVAPGVGTAVRGGLTYREAHLAMELVAESGLLCCLEIVEVNPILDRQNATAALAVELAASAFGAATL
jgi:arginase